MSDVINPLDVSRRVGQLERLINDAGITLELRTDFGYLVRLCETLEDKPYPTAMFNPLHHHIGPDNGFWIKGTDKAGDVVHLQAVRLDDLTGTNLARELETLQAFYFDPSVSAEPGENCRSFAHIAKTITGRVCFHGEIWLKPGDNGFRGKGLAGLLPKLATSLALAHFQPDFIYGFGYPPLVNNGTIISYGYRHFEPDVVNWVRPSRDVPLEAWMCWMTYDDLMNSVRGGLLAEAG